MSARNEAAAKGRVTLDPRQMSPRAQEFETKLAARIVGQERAVASTSAIFQVFIARMNPVNQPVGVLLFLGPTGSGKTKVVEAAAEVLFGHSNAAIKIDCAEFQHSHEIAKLIGSPPGYLGHRETSPMFTQENIDRYHTEEAKLSLLLFDEIEKASDSLWQLLLGILDKATLTLGDNRRVDFSKTIVFMTSNLGAREMSEMLESRIGFAPGLSQAGADPSASDLSLDKKIERTAIEAARRKFSPEFMNRIGKVVVFRSLQEEDLRRVLDLELQDVQSRVMCSAGTKFIFQCSDAAKDLLMREGIDRRYGARHLKRAIERNIVLPLSNLVATEQVGLGDCVYVDFDEETQELTFDKINTSPLIEFVDSDEGGETNPGDGSFDHGAEAALPQSVAARASDQNPGTC